MSYFCCATCKTVVTDDCPTCNKDRSKMKSLALEKRASSSRLLKLPCKYMSFGCPEIIPFYVKRDHETCVCDFRPFKCPYTVNGCSVLGDIPQLVAHLRDDHMVDMYSAASFDRHYVESDPLEVRHATSLMLSVFHCFGQYFYLHFEAFYIGGEPVYIAFLRFMGNKKEARNYGYSLEVARNGQKLTYEGIPHSIRSWHMDIRDTHDGLIIYRKMVVSFSAGVDNNNNKELKLRVSGKIWKKQKNNSNDDDDDGVSEPSICIDVDCVPISS